MHEPGDGAPHAQIAEGGAHLGHGLAPLALRSPVKGHLIGPVKAHPSGPVKRYLSGPVKGGPVKGHVSHAAEGRAHLRHGLAPLLYEKGIGSRFSGNEVDFTNSSI